MGKDITAQQKMWTFAPQIPHRKGQFSETQPVLLHARVCSQRTLWWNAVQMIFVIF